ncbi:hypothetical protein BKA70DRAFT_1268911 [Coprinopsis sp. MPI-PUGE-AT-0042]|nr:hypothetical protein BKA70DRAFT_1268911 [Coprinopsis sp. MPI-PUGE-AT-0042]
MSDSVVPVVDVPMTFGALLVGGIIAIMFSGVTWAQCIIYAKLYAKDRGLVKILVFVVWLLDTLHTVFITLSLWSYLIIHFGKPHFIDVVPTSLALTIVVTAILTFVVHCFFIYRIFILAKRNYFIACPLLFLACARLCFASLTTAKLIQLRSLHGFVAAYTWSFTTGLTLSAIIDVFITGLMCGLLQQRRAEYSSLNNVLDTLILYAFENGVLTTLAALLSLITWITMKHNLIFMATHFIIIKFYANSLLATLNARRELKSGGGLNMIGSPSFGWLSTHRSAGSQGGADGSISKGSGSDRKEGSGGHIGLVHHHHQRSRSRSAGSAFEYGRRVHGRSASKMENMGLAALEEGDGTETKMSIMVNTTQISMTDEERDQKMSQAL